MNTTYSNLLSPIKLGAIEIKNRVIMAPLTRGRATEEAVPTELMAEYYAQRASGGLLIAEATMVMPETGAFFNAPGIYTEAQIEGWKKVTDAVHAKGGKIALQLWHGGRACHPDFNDGKEAVAPSAIAITNDEAHTPKGKKEYAVPRELKVSEIPGIVEGFKQGAINAKKAGFDGVEVHGANGYLIDEFLRNGANKRTDNYGGSIENRARLLFEILKVVSDELGSEYVGLRLSPLNGYNSMSDSNPVELMTWLSKELNKFDLAFLHIMRSDFLGENDASIDILDVCKKYYKGNLIGNMGYNADEADKSIADNKLEAVAFGSSYISNPDLVERFAAQAELNEPLVEYFYTGGAKGYTDYPFMKN